MERERKWLFGRLLGLWRGGIAMAGGGIGFWRGVPKASRRAMTDEAERDSRTQSETPTEMQAAHSIWQAEAALLQGEQAGGETERTESGYFWQGAAAREAVADNRREAASLQTEAARERTARTQDTAAGRMFFLPRTEETMQWQQEGFFRGAEPTTAQEARKALPIEGQGRRTQRREEAERPQTEETQPKREAAPAAQSVDVEEVMRQITKRLREERESSGRRLRR